jgi:hypothetical protein
MTAVHYRPWLIMKIIINLGREILLLGSVRESIMTPFETSSEKTFFYLSFFHKFKTVKIKYNLNPKNHIRSCGHVSINNEAQKKILD